MKRIFVLYLFLSCCIMAKSQNIRFDGGMMVHAGPMTADYASLDFHNQGATFGMGGTLRFHFGSHVRVGGEGFVSTMKHMGNGSYSRTGWGGAVVDAYWTFGRWMPFAGVAAGGGKCSTLLVFEGSDGDWEAEPDAVLHNESFFFVSPNIGVEVALTHAVHHTLLADRLVPTKKIEMPLGWRFYLGFVFAH